MTPDQWADICRERWAALGFGGADVRPLNTELPIAGVAVSYTDGGRNWWFCGTVHWDDPWMEGAPAASIIECVDRSLCVIRKAGLVWQPEVLDTGKGEA